MVSRKELVDISVRGLCGGWKAGNSRKRSRRSPEARTAGGPTLRGWHDLLGVRPNRGDLTSGELPAPSTKPNKSQRLLLGDLGPLRPASTIAAPPTRPPSRLHPKAKRPSSPALGHRRVRQFSGKTQTSTVSPDGGSRRRSPVKRSQGPMHRCASRPPLAPLRRLLRAARSRRYAAGPRPGTGRTAAARHKTTTSPCRQAG